MKSARTAPLVAGRFGFDYLSPDDVYLDSACQTLRPEPVVEALNEYFHRYNACGERVQYDWGRRVDAEVAATREKVVRMLGLSPRRHTTSFTLNTTYGVNLLLLQQPAGRYARIVTTHTEHNSVFVSTIAHARRLGIERVVLERAADGSIDTRDRDLSDALVVVSAMNNVDGTVTPGLGALVSDVHRAGGSVIVDAAQAAPHALSALRGVAADAICFSAHKMYGASLGVVVAADAFLESLDLAFVGGGQVADVTESGYELLPHLETRLEPGLQAWGEIIALGAAIDWIAGYERATGESLEARETRLSRRLFDGIRSLPHVAVLGRDAAPVVSFVPQRVDAHRLATFLSHAHVMVRSGYFCAHHWLRDRLASPPLVRLSLGAHNTDDDVDRALQILQRLVKGL